MNNTTLYGIKNCDTVKKTRNWLDSRSIDYRFHDFRSDGIEASLVQGWLKKVSWQTLLNKRGTTWRKLPEQTQAGVNADSIVPLLVEQPTLIKRPVLSIGDNILVGFSEADYVSAFKDQNQ
jgi:arsenate reductase (glutaredoxin)